MHGSCIASRYGGCDGELFAQLISVVIHNGDQGVPAARLLHDHLIAFEQLERPIELGARDAEPLRPLELGDDERSALDFREISTEPELASLVVRREKDLDPDPQQKKILEDPVLHERPVEFDPPISRWGRVSSRC